MWAPQVKDDGGITQKENAMPEETEREMVDREYRGKVHVPKWLEEIGREEKLIDF